MRDLFRKIKVYERKDKIQAISVEKQYLEEILYEGLMGHGPLNGPQRMDVLKNLVERVKAEKLKEKEISLEKLAETEEKVDILKSISFFNLI